MKLSSIILSSAFAIGTYAGDIGVDTPPELIHDAKQFKGKSNGKEGGKFTAAMNHLLNRESKEEDHSGRRTEGRSGMTQW